MEKPMTIKEAKHALKISGTISSPQTYELMEKLVESYEKIYYAAKAVVDQECGSCERHIKTCPSRGSCNVGKLRDTLAAMEKAGGENA